MSEITANPSKYLELQAKEIPTYLTKEEIDQLLSVIKKPHHHLLINFLWSTGARISEALLVEVKDINFNKKEITLWTLKRRKPTKRIIPMAENLALELATYLYQNNIQEGKIFKFTRQTAWYLTKRYFAKAKLTKKPHPHIFRHSFGFNCSSQGLHPRLLQRLLGHASLLNTAIYYNPSHEFVKEQFSQIKF